MSEAPDEDPSRLDRRVLLVHACVYGLSLFVVVVDGALWCGAWCSLFVVIEKRFSGGGG